MAEEGEDRGVANPFPFPFPLSTLLGRVQVIYTAEYDRRLTEAGLPDMTLSLGTNVMRHLHGEAGVRMSRLVELAGVTKQAISQQVAQLERTGYVVVEPDPDDLRAKQVRLTKKGMWSQQVARPIFAEMEKDWHRRFGPAVGDLRGALEQILTDVGDTDVAPARSGSSRVDP